MSPLEIDILLRMYVFPDPWEGEPIGGRTSQAMTKAFDKFRQKQIIHPLLSNLDLNSFKMVKHSGQDFLTIKGVALVNKLREVTIDDLPTPPTKVGEMTINGKLYVIYHDAYNDLYGMFHGVLPGKCVYKTVKYAVQMALDEIK